MEYTAPRPSELTSLKALDIATEALLIRIFTAISNDIVELPERNLFRVPVLDIGPTVRRRVMAILEKSGWKVTYDDHWGYYHPQEKYLVIGI